MSIRKLAILKLSTFNTDWLSQGKYLNYVYKSKIVLFLHLDLIKNLISPNIRTLLGEERVPSQESYLGATHQLVR